MGRGNATGMAGTAASDPLERVAIRLGDAPDPHAWRQGLGSFFDFSPKASERSEAPAAHLEAWHFGFFLLCRSAGFSGRLMRRTDQASLDDLDHLVVTMPLRGMMGFAGSEPCIIRPGDVAIYDLRAEIACTLRDSDALHLILPRLFYQQPSRRPTRWHRVSCAANVFRPPSCASSPQVWRGCRPMRRARKRSRWPRFSEHRLRCASARRKALITTTDDGRRMRDLRRHIEDNLNDPSLTPAALADRFGLSRSQLFRQFESRVA